MKWLKRTLCSTALILATSSQCWSTNVAVYTESGVIESSNKVHIKIFADISDVRNGGPLVSAGVKLSYDSHLNTPVANKNDNDWYFGTSNSKLTYVDPDVSTSGEIVFLLGKLDQNKPLEGNSGNRILLGSVTFDYTGEIPTAASITLMDGHEDNFIDYANTSGSDLDSAVTYSVPSFTSMSTLHLKGAIRTLQLLSGSTTDVPLRATDGDINGDGRIGIAETISLLNQAAL
jgi:hypothetical protein